MNGAEFNKILKKLGVHPSENEQFKVDPKRKKEFECALEIAKALFPDAKTAIEDDPLKLGALILSVETHSIDVCGSENMLLFFKMIEKADDFTVYSTDPEDICMALFFQDVLKQIK